MVCDITTGLEGFYKFSNNANDSSGNARNGTNNGGTFVNDKDSNPLSALSFDGVNDFMTTIDWSGIGIKSINWWALIDSTGTFNNNTPFFSDIAASAAVAFVIARISSTGITFQKNTAWTTGVLTRNTDVWEMHTLTVDGSNLRYYRDSVLEKTVATTDTPILSVNENLNLGREAFSPSFSKIILDEFRLYSQILDQDSIDALFTGFDTPTCAVDQNTMAFGGGL